MNEFKRHQVSFFQNGTTHKLVIIVAPVNCILVASLCCNDFCGICFRLSVWTMFKDDMITSGVLCWEIGISEQYWLVIRLSLCHSKQWKSDIPVIALASPKTLSRCNSHSRCFTASAVMDVTVLDECWTVSMKSAIPYQCTVMTEPFLQQYIAACPEHCQLVLFHDWWQRSSTPVSHH